MALNERQQRFADYYVQTGNATESARRAGYSERTAKQIGSRLLTVVDVQKYIADRNQELEYKRIAGMEEVKRFWTDLMRDGEADPKDRLKASEYIAKTNAAFVDRVEEKRDVTLRVSVDDD